MPPWQIAHFTADAHTVERFHHGDLLSSDGAEGSKVTTVNLAARHTFQVPYTRTKISCHLISAAATLFMADFFGTGVLPEHFLWVTESLEGCTTSEPDLRMNCHPLSQLSLRLASASTWQSLTCSKQLLTTTVCCGRPFQ